MTLVKTHSEGMLTSSPSAPWFVRISDRELTEIQLHSVNSIDDLHRTHSEQLRKGSRPARPPAPSTNGNVVLHTTPAVYQMDHPMRPQWVGLQKVPVGSRLLWPLVAVSFFITLLLLLILVARQVGLVNSVSELVQHRQNDAQQISDLKGMIQNLQKNLTRMVH